jgi:hypothetical protein
MIIFDILATLDFSGDLPRWYWFYSLFYYMITSDALIYSWDCDKNLSISGGWQSSPIPQPNNELAIILRQLDLSGTLKLQQDHIKLGQSCLQAASQVALGHRATMLCKRPKNTILVISWQGLFYLF